MAEQAVSSFNTGTFTGASATANGHTGTISDPAWQNDAEIMGSSDQVTIQGWYAGSTAQLQEIKTADGSMLDAQLSQLVQAMASYEAANPGFNPTASGVSQAPSDPSLQNVIAAAWHH